MTTMGKYCKAYLLGQLRQYDAWAEQANNARVETNEADGTDVPRELTDESIVYIQENYVVTDGIFKDENIIFDGVTPDWITYCQHELSFEIPDVVNQE